MFGRKRSNEPQINPALEREFSLLENFSNVCVNKCISNEHLERDLEHEDKICIARCLDRSYEYMRLLKNTK